MELEFKNLALKEKVSWFIKTLQIVLLYITSWKWSQFSTKFKPICHATAISSESTESKIRPFMNTYSACVTGAVSPGDFSSWLFCLYFLIKSIRNVSCAPIFFTNCWTIRSLSARRAATYFSWEKEKKISTCLLGKIL